MDLKTSLEEINKIKEILGMKIIERVCEPIPKQRLPLTVKGIYSVAKERSTSSEYMPTGCQCEEQMKSRREARDAVVASQLPMT